MKRKGSAEWKRNVAEGSCRGLKAWRDGLQVLPSHVRALLHRGQVAKEIRPMISDAARWIYPLRSPLETEVQERCSRSPAHI